MTFFDDFNIIISKQFHEETVNYVLLLIEILLLFCAVHIETKKNVPIKLRRLEENCIAY